MEYYSKNYLVVAPVFRNGNVTFDKYQVGDEVELEYATSKTSVKKFFFPPKETLLTFSGGEISTPAYDEKIMVFGLSRYDAKAIEILDTAFGEPLEDTHYMRRRKNAVFIGCVGPHMENSFSITNLENTICDLILVADGDSYKIQILNQKGNDLVKNKFIERAQGTDPQIEDIYTPDLDLQKVMNFLDKGPDQEIWHSLAKKCFACGVCAYVCPICHCFDVEDNLCVNGKTGERIRCHDSCMLADFAKVAMGGNFRRDRHERIHNWYHHKFSRAVKERGVPDCVGCGRCITHCPAKIDILQVIKDCEAQG